VEFEDAIKKEENPFESDSPFALFSALMGKPEVKKVKPNSIALLYMTGSVVDGPIEEAAYEDGYISAFPLVDMLEKIRLEENISAVVIRVDSGGGSAYASDQIWEAVERLKADKPVVISMASVAASGGYYVAMGADYIFADPMTITGSIGVIGAKPYVGGLIKEIGIDLDSVSVGRRINPFSLYSKWTPEEYSSLIDNMEETYQDFITKAAAGRGVEVSYIHEHAQGRVWSGRDALRLGLIDGAGGLLAAIDKAEELAGLDASETQPLQVYPGKLSFSQILEKAFGGLQVAAGVAPARGDAMWRSPFSRLVSASFGPLALELIPAQALDQMGALYHIFKTEGVALAEPAIVVFN
jgi:protease-4